jgi:hypothetical protein
LIRHILTYNVALGFAHYVSRPQTLLPANNNVFARAGIAPDSVSRLTAIAGPLGLSLAGTRVPTSVQSNAFTWLGRLDDELDTLNTCSLTGDKAKPEKAPVPQKP